MIDWDARWLELARVFGGWSKDRSTKIGCVIVDPQSRSLLSPGYNGFPRGINDDIDERHERPGKYKWTEHAERNAIYNAARHGIKLSGASMYVLWFPCSDCARAIIQTGITELVASPDAVVRFGPSWDDDFAISRILLDEAGIRVRLISVQL